MRREQSHHQKTKYEKEDMPENVYQLIWFGTLNYKYQNKNLHTCLFEIIGNCVVKRQESLLPGRVYWSS